VDGSDIVVCEEGTGLLHVAPGAGKEDFDLGVEKHLPIISVIADDASYLDGMEELSGKNAKKHPELIIDFLHTKGDAYLLKTMQYTHRYPACWRCKTELVWKVTEEWYIAMDRPSQKASDGKATLREQMMETAKMIDWHPAFGLDRELDWLSNMHDWLISKKNRYWGLALPIYECPQCRSFTILGSKEELKEKAVSGWDSFEGKSPHKPFIDDVTIRCQHCDSEITRIDDVGNVWLDAGIVPFSTYVDPKTKQLSYTTDKTYWKEWFPVDFITESFPGQFKNWFYSMIAMATVLEKRNPFKTVLGYASVLDEKSKPMHKSAGNAIEFNTGADTIGVDVMRWMFCLSDPEQNMLFGYKKADEVRRKFHILLWNVYNFFLTYARVDGFTPDESNHTSSHVLDRWIYSRLYHTIQEVTLSMETYKPKVAAETLETFVTDLSQWYVRRSRDRVGPTTKDVKDGLVCYQTLYTVLVTLVRLLAPFIPHVSEAMFKNLTRRQSVHLSDWPVGESTWENSLLEDEMIQVRLIVERIHAKRKELGIAVRKPLNKSQISNFKSQISEELIHLIRDETNIKAIEFRSGEGDLEVELDTVITPELEKEGIVRDAIRTIHKLRKEKECGIDQSIALTLPRGLQSLDTSYLDDIKRETLTKTIVWGDSYSISTSH